ncbi:MULTISPECIES: methionyl-tRNA formyltransferase [Sphingomonas]|jgi:hypothetical protein|uniref:methionyl-tRNA formyltransferase n=1 Tax=Sphingomonas TaxID=13687 RepID=UPI001143638B|nr:MULTISPECIES: methionyl-tRNA formyltransferase [Sphingomonas]
MATVRDLQLSDGAGARPHTDVSAKLRLIELNGEKFVQIDTYGSDDRQEVGKQSQSVRLSKTAFDQLIQHGSKHF